MNNSKTKVVPKNDEKIKLEKEKKAKEAVAKKEQFKLLSRFLLE